MTVTRIISGGQTGADRGALDAAMDLGLDWGGWAPAGWRAEDGQIPERYRAKMIQSGSAGYPVRTRANIESSDATLILSIGPLAMDSGSYLTAKMARTIGKPCRHMMIESISLPALQRMMILEWWMSSIGGDGTLNVAGPRESREPGVQAAVRSALVSILAVDSIAFVDPWS